MKRAAPQLKEIICNYLNINLNHIYVNYGERGEIIFDCRSCDAERIEDLTMNHPFFENKMISIRPF